MHTFGFGSPHISTQQPQLFKILLSTTLWGRHKKFEDQMLLSQDMRKPKLKSAQFYPVTLYIILLPHSALSWNWSLAENLESVSWQDGATKWHYYWTYQTVQLSGRLPGQPYRAKLFIYMAHLIKALNITFGYKPEVTGGLNLDKFKIILIGFLTNVSNKEDLQLKATTNIKSDISQRPPIGSFQKSR